jgi:hypothetical protein
MSPAPPSDAHRWCGIRRCSLSFLKCFEPVVGEKQTVFEAAKLRFFRICIIFLKRNSEIGHFQRNTINSTGDGEASWRLQSWLRWVQTCHRALIGKNRARPRTLYLQFRSDFQLYVFSLGNTKIGVEWAALHRSRWTPRVSDHAAGCHYKSKS